MNRFQRTALTAFIAVEVLIFVGAAVRATGSGLGCPDWPFCYGCWIPPRSPEDFNLTDRDLEKFRAKAARLGRDPATITRESLRAEFDPVSTWVEYLNRLTSLPVGLSITVLLFASLGQWRQGRRAVFAASAAAFILVVVNAWLGARVVFSGLRPGTITLHMALAILLQCVLVYAAWRGTSSPLRLAEGSTGLAATHRLAMLLFGLVVVEGVMGSQVREMTDELARHHAGQSRAAWITELEHTWVYLIHRSFSWLILGSGLWFTFRALALQTRLRWLETVVLLLIFAQMALGLVLSQFGIVKLAQILHIGLSSLLVSGLFFWLLASRSSPTCGAGAAPAMS